MWFFAFTKNLFWNMEGLKASGTWAFSNQLSPPPKNLLAYSEESPTLARLAAA